MAGRSKAREVAFQVLYQDDLNPRNNPAVGDGLIKNRLDSDELIEFARELVAGYRRNREVIDRAITEAAVNWKLERMAATDRNTLRIGAYEILCSDTPDPVAINEAVDLAKRYGTAQSAGFVNGILDHLMHNKQPVDDDHHPTPAMPDPPTPNP